LAREGSVVGAGCSVIAFLEKMKKICKFFIYVETLNLIVKNRMFVEDILTYYKNFK